VEGANRQILDAASADWDDKFGAVIDARRAQDESSATARRRWKMLLDVGARERERQGGTLLHFSPQSEPLLSPKLRKHPTYSAKSGNVEQKFGRV
jgi:hypothetical protein